MFPKTADFKSGDGAAMWFWWPDVADKNQVWLYQSQWPTAVAKTQQFLRNVLTSAGVEFTVTHFDPATGQCTHGSTLAMLPARAQADTIKTAEIAIDGKWGRQTADVLGFFLCQIGSADAAKTVGNDIIAQKLSPQTVRVVLWLAFFMTPSSVNLESSGQRVGANEQASAKSITLDTNTILPEWNVNPLVADANKAWWSRSLRGAALENPPTIGSGTRPWPAGTTVNTETTINTETDTPSGKTDWFKWLLLAGAAAAGYMLLTDNSRSAPEPIDVDFEEDAELELESAPEPYQLESGPRGYLPPPRTESVIGIVDDIETIGPVSAREVPTPDVEHPGRPAGTRALNDALEKAWSARKPRTKKIGQALAYGQRVAKTGKTVSLQHAKDLGYNAAEAKVAHEASLVGNPAKRGRTKTITVESTMLGEDV